MIIRMNFIFLLLLLLHLLFPSSLGGNEQQLPINSPPGQSNRKIAFLFLIRWNLPLLEIWQEFFTFNAPKEKYNIYVHSSIPFHFPEGSVFYNRTISDHIEAKWGKFSLVQATRYLMKAGLRDDINNYYFALFSESCIPLYSFSKFYRILTSNSLSIVFAKPALISEHRWRNEFDSITRLVKSNSFRKSSQWIMLIRKHALLISAYTMDDQVWEKVPAADEYFIPSTLAALKLENETTGLGGFTFVNWSLHQSHPKRFYSSEINEKLFHHLRYSHASLAHSLTIDELDKLNYHLQCSGYKGICHFVARKFAASSKFQLLSQLSYLLIDDRDDIYFSPNPPPFPAMKSYEDEYLFPSSLNGTVLRYPGFDYFLNLFPKLRKCSLFDKDPIESRNSNISLTSITSKSFWKSVSKKYLYYYLDQGEKKTIPNLNTVRFFFHLPEETYSIKDLLLQIPTITKKDLELYSKHKEHLFPSISENQLLRDKWSKSNETWIIQGYERHFISFPMIQQLFHNGTLKSIDIIAISESLLEQIPVGKPFSVSTNSSNFQLV